MIEKITMKLKLCPPCGSSFFTQGKIIEYVNIAKYIFKKKAKIKISL